MMFCVRLIAKKIRSIENSVWSKEISKTGDLDESPTRVKTQANRVSSIGADSRILGRRDFRSSFCPRVIGSVISNFHIVAIVFTSLRNGVSGLPSGRDSRPHLSAAFENKSRSLRPCIESMAYDHHATLVQAR